MKNWISKLLGVQAHESRPLSAVDDYVIVNRRELDKLLGKLKIDKSFDIEYSKTITELMEELSIARMLIRELGDRLAKLEKPWVGLTDREVEDYWDWEDFQCGCGKGTLFEMVRNIEAKLKEKNNAS